MLTASRCRDSACAGTRPWQSAVDLGADDGLGSGPVVPWSQFGGRQGEEQAGDNLEAR